LFLKELKLNSLKLQKNRLRTHFSKVLEESKKCSLEIDRVKVLWQGVCDSPVKGIAENLNLSNIGDLIEQVDGDLSIGQTVLKSFSEKLINCIEKATIKFDCAFLYGCLLTEWLKVDSVNESKDEFNDNSVEESFADIGRPEKLETRIQLESLIFNASTADVSKFSVFLKTLFAVNVDTTETEKTDLFERNDPRRNRQRGRRGQRGRGGATRADAIWITHVNAPVEGQEIPFLQNTLTNLCKQMKNFGDNIWKEYQISSEDVDNTISSLLFAGDLLTDEKRATASEIKASPVVLAEVASVLNILLRDLEHWDWPQDGINMNLKRALNGKYRCFPDEDLITIIFLHYIGLQWSIKLRGELKKIVESNIWKRPKNPLTEQQQLIRAQMIGDFSSASIQRGKCIFNNTGEKFLNDFFMPMLPESMDGNSFTYGDDDEDENNKHKKVDNVKLKQHLLHRILTECNYAQNVNPKSEFTVVSADLEWFGPSLSHSILLETLRFSGIPEPWLGFFRKFLQMPCKFAPIDSPKKRMRGTPISHSISTFLAELMLFYLEFAVNQATDGIQFYRLHDDFWFFDEDLEKCMKTWKVMNEFSDLVGLEWNKEKCGSVKIFGKDHPGKSDSWNPAPEPLPQNPSRWGFIKLHSNGRFIIDQSNLDTHIVEMQRQLQKPKSVLGTIQVYNKYISFLVRNFGEPVRIFGQSHVEEIIASLKRVHQELFKPTSGDVLSFINQQIQSKFPGYPIFEAWILWPMSLGGLGLKNPLIEIYSLLRAYKSENQSREKLVMTAKNSVCNSFKEALEIDLAKYRQFKTAWEKRAAYPNMKHLLNPEDYETVDEKVGVFADWNDESDVENNSSRKENKRPRFMSYEDYCLPRKAYTSFSHWEIALELLLKSPDLDEPEQIKHSLENLRSPLNEEWENIPLYWKHIVAFYGDQIVSNFGSLSFFSNDLIPLGMVDAFKSTSVKWEQ
ncbi:hypothetical protein HK096_002501, partial [Nowakowskiella sp. JEL0078]